MIIIPCKKAANEEAIFDKTTYSCTFSKNNSTTIEKTKVANSM